MFKIRLVPPLLGVAFLCLYIKLLSMQTRFQEKYFWKHLQVVGKFALKFYTIKSSKVRSLQDQKYSKTFKDLFNLDPRFPGDLVEIYSHCLFSKTFQRPLALRAISCRKIASVSTIFTRVIIPVKSHPKIRLFVDICENLALQSIYFIS